MPGPAYWNHNTAYHPWLLARIPRGADVLDVGCGDGLLLERLAPRAGTAVGLEPHDTSRRRAEQRLVGFPNVRVDGTPFLDLDGTAAFDVIVLVAVLHHLPLEPALIRARELLRPGGRLLVVGLARNDSVADWSVSGLQLPIVRFVSAWRREARDIGVPVADPQESLARIRAVARRLLPGVRIRRGLYYRYLLEWVAPGGRGG